MPGSTRKHTQPTNLRVPLGTSEHDGQSDTFDDVSDEKQRFIRETKPGHEVVNIGFSTKEKLMIVAVIIVLSVCVFVAVFIGIKTSGHANTYQGCPPLKPPLHGGMSYTNATGDVNVKCTFACGKGYLPNGPNEVTCIGGKWSGRPPVCGPACSELKPVAFGDFKCSNGYFINSTCTCTCTDDHLIKGNSSLTCQSNRQWSHPEPNCTCPPCFIGDKCQYSISWELVRKKLDLMEPYDEITVHYGEETFTCRTELHSILGKWSGICTGDKTEKKCHNYDSVGGAAKHAAAELIRTLVSQKKCPEPCDPQDMETGCSE